MSTELPERICGTAKEQNEGSKCAFWNSNSSSSSDRNNGVRPVRISAQCIKLQLAFLAYIWYLKVIWDASFHTPTPTAPSLQNDIKWINVCPLLQKLMQLTLERHAKSFFWKHSTIPANQESQNMYRLNWCMIAKMGAWRLIDVYRSTWFCGRLVCYH